MENISDNNPHLEEMEERGWAWIHREPIENKHGAPYTNDEYATESAQRFHPEERKDGFSGLPTPASTIELIIVSWEE